MNRSRRAFLAAAGGSLSALSTEAYDPRDSCGIGALSLEGIDAVALTEYLEREYRIHVRPRVVEGELNCIRVTPNVFTTLEEVDFFAEAIVKVARKGLV